MNRTEEVEIPFEKQYEKLEKLGEGTYGEVYKGRIQEATTGTPGDFVAIKRVKLDGEDDGLPSTTLREVTLLLELEHPNVVRLMDVHCALPAAKNLNLVFEFVDQDLKRFSKTNGPAPPELVKSLTYQLLKGVEYCHKRRIIHRDLKPQNLLIDSKRRLKIADFGLARALCLPVPKYTHEVVTVWYRSPEILLGSPNYSLPVDMWSCGCITAEMAHLSPLFPGDSEIDTIFRIFRKLGTPTDDLWPDCRNLPDMKQSFPKWGPRGWQNIPRLTQVLGQNGIDCVAAMLLYDPKYRISAKRALTLPYFADVQTN